MKLLKRLMLLLAWFWVMVLTGCAPGMSSEDREFFYGSWIHPLPVKHAAPEAVEGE